MTILNGKYWSTEETEYLLNHINREDLKTIGDRLGRSPDSIRGKAIKLGIYERKREGVRFWTPQEEMFLELNYSKMDAKTLAKKLDRSLLSVRRKAEDMRIRYFDEIISMTQLAKAFGCDKCVIARWIRKYGLPCKRIRRGRGYYYSVDIAKFWQWADQNRNRIVWRNYRRSSLLPEPAWLDEAIYNDAHPLNSRKSFTLKEKNAILTDIASGKSTKHIARKYGRSEVSIRHLRKQVRSKKLS